jgi:CCR4-NOT transcriptional regulation complex NOT5 subunit
MDILGLHIELSRTHRKRIMDMRKLHHYLTETITWSPENDVKDSNIWTNTRKLISNFLGRFNQDYPYF